MTASPGRSLPATHKCCSASHATLTRECATSPTPWASQNGRRNASLPTSSKPATSNDNASGAATATRSTPPRPCATNPSTVTKSDTCSNYSNKHQPRAMPTTQRAPETPQNARAEQRLPSRQRTCHQDGRARHGSGRGHGRRSKAGGRDGHHHARFLIPAASHCVGRRSYGIPPRFGRRPQGQLLPPSAGPLTDVRL